MNIFNITGLNKIWFHKLPDHKHPDEKENKENFKIEWPKYEQQNRNDR
jgi:hypothetical protein